MSSLRSIGWWADRYLERLCWRGGLPVPRLVKWEVVESYSYAADVFVETGTYLGHMANAASQWFDEVHTIELEPTLAEKARQRFRHDPSIHVYEGDSSKILPDVLARVDRPALFWLDAHYSRGITARGDIDTPVADELRLVLQHPMTRAILIDDARLFGQGDYPALEKIQDHAEAAGKRIEVELDIIRLT